MYQSRSDVRIEIQSAAMMTRRTLMATWAKPNELGSF